MPDRDPAKQRDQGPDPDQDAKFEALGFVRAFDLLLGDPEFGRMQEVLPFRGLFVGPQKASRDVSALMRAGVTHLLCANGTGVFAAMARAFTCLTLDLDDAEDEDIAAAVPQAVQFIAHARRRGEGVLVFCSAGRSRSVTLAAAYIMAVQRCGADDALALVRRARKFAAPNRGFVRALRRLEAARARDWDAPAPRGCELCVLERSTQWFRETRRFVVLECDQCGLPMAVWRAHAMRAAPAGVAAMRAALEEVAAERLGAGEFFVDERQRTIHDHLHWHARPKEGLPWLAHQMSRSRARL